MRNAELLLAEGEDVVPQARFEMAFHLRQIEIGTGSALDLRRCVVEEEQAEIEERRRYRRAVHQ